MEEYSPVFLICFYLVASGAYRFGGSRSGCGASMHTAFLLFYRCLTFHYPHFITPGNAGPGGVR